MKCQATSGIQRRQTRRCSPSPRLSHWLAHFVRPSIHSSAWPEKPRWGRRHWPWWEVFSSLATTGRSNPILSFKTSSAVILSWTAQRFLVQRFDPSGFGSSQTFCPHTVNKLGGVIKAERIWKPEVPAAHDQGLWYKLHCFDADRTSRLPIASNL